MSLKNKIDVAMGREVADLVLKNASMINVYTQTIVKGDLAIKNGLIVGIGEYEGLQEIDCTGSYVTPGFIDAHVHIESSMVTPELFSHLAIQNGVTTIVADPHEIANVMGNEGLSFMLNNSLKGVIDTYFMLPSCVPAIEFEDSGAILYADDLEQLMNQPNVLGLGEVMDVPSVINANESMLDKIRMTKRHNKQIDGHCPKVDDKGLNAYLSAGIKTDHECTDQAEALEKVSKGMMVMLREGSAARDLVNLLPAVNFDNYHRFLFCTDDRHIEDLIEEGSIDHCIRLAIKEGLDPIKAYTMASFNAATCYHLYDRGAIAPGKKADLVIFDDLEALKIKQVLKDGKVYVSEHVDSSVEKKRTVHLEYVEEVNFKIKEAKPYVHVIKSYPGLLKTSKVMREVELLNGQFVGVREQGEPINKIAIFERHHKTGKQCVGFIEGLGLKNGAIAQSIAHDSHNLIVLGDSDRDMAIAVNHLIDQDGGIVVVSNGKVMETLRLPIAGIMTDQDPRIVLEQVKRMNHMARELGIKDGFDPFITLSFMALPVIPELKITPRGLFDYSRFNFIDLFTEKES